MGFACGPIFPWLIAETPQRLGPRHGANAIGVQIAWAAIGMSLAPTLVGVVAEWYGVAAIPWGLTALAALMLIAFAALQRGGAKVVNFSAKPWFARCLQCWHYASMPIQITIRDVPEKVRDELAARAALQGKSMQEFLRSELERLAGRPSVDAWLEQVRKRKRASQTRVSVREILKARDAGRR